MLSIASIPFSDIFNLDFAAVAIITALLLAVGHFFPWEDMPHWLTGGRPLGRVKCYVYGILAIFTPLCVLMWNRGYREAVVMIVANVVIGGLSVFACYGFDHWRAQNKAARQAIRQAREAARQAKIRAREAEEREAQLRHLIDADEVSE